MARVFQGISSHSNSLSSWYLVILLNSKTKRFAAGRNKVLKSKETFDKNHFFEQNWLFEVSDAVMRLLVRTKCSLNTFKTIFNNAICLFNLPVRLPPKPTFLDLSTKCEGTPSAVITTSVTCKFTVQFPPIRLANLVDLATFWYIVFN